LEFINIYTSFLQQTVSPAAPAADPDPGARNETTNNSSPYGVMMQIPACRRVRPGSPQALRWRIDRRPLQLHFNPDLAFVSLFFRKFGL
jgi:hypothetical protein